MLLLRLVSVAVVLTLGVSVAIAEEFIARITKVEGDKITLTKLEKGKKGAESTFTVAKKVKVATAKFAKDDDGKFKISVGDDIKDGLKNERFKDIGKGGIVAQITTDDDGKTGVTKILVFPGKGKIKKKPKKDD